MRCMKTVSDGAAVTLASSSCILVSMSSTAVRKRHTTPSTRQCYSAFAPHFMKTFTPTVWVMVMTRVMVNERKSASG